MRLPGKLRQHEHNAPLTYLEEDVEVKMEFDLLVYLALVLIVVVISIAAWVLVKTPETEDTEARKIRFAAATFTGITMLFVFSASLYFAGGKEGPGREIFDKGLSAMFTLAGSIVGYLFGSIRAGSSVKTDNLKDASKDASGKTAA